MVIDFRAQPVLVRLSILRHQNDRRLEDLKHVQGDGKKQIRIRIESFPAAQKRWKYVYQDPQIKNDRGRDDEFPTPAKFRNNVRGPVRKSKLCRLLHIDVARRGMTQQLIRMPKPVGKCSQHFQRDIGAAPHEREKMLARQDSQRCVFHYHCVCRAALTVEQRHFPKPRGRPWLARKCGLSRARSNTLRRLRRRCGTETRRLCNRGYPAGDIIRRPPRYRAIQTTAPGAASQ